MRIDTLLIILLALCFNSCGTVRKTQSSSSSVILADTTSKQEQTSQTAITEQVTTAKDTVTIHTDSTVTTKVVEVEFYPQADTAKSYAVYATSANREIAERPKQLIKKIKVTEQTKQSNTEASKGSQMAQNSKDTTATITISTEAKAGKIEAKKEQIKDKKVKRFGWIWIVAILGLGAVGYIYYKRRNAGSYE